MTDSLSIALFGWHSYGRQLQQDDLVSSVQLA